MAAPNLGPKTYYTNFSNGWIVEVVNPPDLFCESWLLIPGENLWSKGLRGFLYILALLYLFLGIAIASDIFMMSIEVITSKRKTVVKWDEERKARVEREVLVWNETVANLTLMALGSSAPEILLAVVETASNLSFIERGLTKDSIGTFTIIGSAAFNLMIITAICISSVPHPSVKHIKEIGVFIITSIWSIFAYFWMLIVVLFVSPGEVEMWEAWVTFLFFPLMVLMAYCQDNGWFIKRKAVGDEMQSQTNFRIVAGGDNRRNSVIHGPSRELAALQKNKTNEALAENGQANHDNERHDVYITTSPTSKEEPVVSSQRDLPLEDVLPNDEMRQLKVVPHLSQGSNLARARFRHAAVRSMLGGKKQSIPKTKMADVVEVVQHSNRPVISLSEDLAGRFTFGAPSYSVLESAGILDIDVLFHRRAPPRKNPILAAMVRNASDNNLGVREMNGGLAYQNSALDTSLNSKEDTGELLYQVEFETREGSGKIDKDFKYKQGILTFQADEYIKTISVPIINDNQYEADVDFYCLLKNPTGESCVGLGDPSVSRITIIDDDQPGEFQFEEPHYYADLKTGYVCATVVRDHGCDGNVAIEYSTIDGTAKGGTDLEEKVDYKRAEGKVQFKHGETSQKIYIECNKKSTGSKNFIITLRNPSLGAKIGDHSATVANITTDDIAERIAEVIGDDEEEEITWAKQFQNAMVLEAEQDDDGEDIPLRWYDYTLHFLSFFWKVLFAFIPPKSYLGAWPQFVCSLIAVGLLSAVVEQLGTLLGCVIGLRTAVAGATIVALGTSLPDTFASRTAALHDEHADAAIGNVTGSNSVNVFLGLGIPWIIQCIYALAIGKKFLVSTDNLVSSVVIFSILGTMTIFILLIRRKAVGGELGGAKKFPKISCSVLLVLFWIVYIALVTVKAYSPDMLPW